MTVAGGVVTGAQWQVSTDAGADWSNVPYATAMSYSFVAAAGDNGYEYRALLTNASGSRSRAPRRLTVRPPGDVAPQVTTATYESHRPLREKREVHRGRVGHSGAGHPVGGIDRRRTELEHDHQRDRDQVHGSAQLRRDRHEYRAVFTNVAGTVATNPASLVVAAGSRNWSGYVALDQGFSSVTGSWKVPAVTCPATPPPIRRSGSESTGHENGPTVEQVGTESDCLDGVPTYHAWYAMWGDRAVNDGDVVELSPSVDRCRRGTR